MHMAPFPLSEKEYSLLHPEAHRDWGARHWPQPWSLQLRVTGSLRLDDVSAPESHGHSHRVAVTAARVTVPMIRVQCTAMIITMTEIVDREREMLPDHILSDSESAQAGHPDLDATDTSKT